MRVCSADGFYPLAECFVYDGVCCDKRSVGRVCKVVGLVSRLEYLLCMMEFVVEIENCNSNGSGKRYW